MEIKLSPSILAADFANLERDIKLLRDAEYLHIDVMDGIFVNNISFGFPVMQSIRKVTDLFFDVHLMITEPERYLWQFYDSGADLLTVHVEACKDIRKTIREIKQMGIKAGVTLKPFTDLSTIMHIIDEVDVVLVMAVDPGHGGQKFMPSTYDRLKLLRRIVDTNNLKAEIEVDGGINLDNLPSILESGARVIVVGSAIFKGGNPAEEIDKFHKAFREFEGVK